MNQNPITRLDYPDPDIIRVNDTYYMVTTTMYFMPGCEILRSYDLLHWEVVTHVYDVLEDTPEERLENGKSAYGKGMWAASLRYHNGKFYVCFVANDTGKTYLYTSKDIEGPWKKQTIEGFYHDNSMLFDEDGKVYIVYGNTTIYLTELNEELSGPKEGGLHRILTVCENPGYLGYEGSHFYKINGKYYLFVCHWPADGSGRKVQSCLVGESLTGEFHGKIVIDSDMGYCNQGVAQGGIVDTIDGKWFGMMFQDRGAVGRIPYLVPMHWEDEFPVFDTEQKEMKIKTTHSDYQYTPLVGSDNFAWEEDKNGRVIPAMWQWNHIPVNQLWSVTKKPSSLQIETGKLCNNVTMANNTLTQRMSWPGCEGSITVDASDIKDGDYAGICALQGCYGMIAITREKDQYYLVMKGKEAKDSSIFGEKYDASEGTEYAKIPMDSCKARLKVVAEFMNQKDEASFYYEGDGQWIPLGIVQKLYFKMDHFTGCRFGLFYYATREVGGRARFMNFVYEEDESSL